MRNLNKNIQSKKKYFRLLIKLTATKFYKIKKDELK